MPISEAIASALIGAAGPAAGGLFGAGSAALSNRRQYKWSRKFFDYQNAYNQMMYSPAMNMQRYRAAGINPHEVAGGGNSGTSISGNMSVPDYQNPIDPIANSVPAAIEQAMSMYFQKKQLENNQSLVDSQVEKNRAEANKTNYQVANILPYTAQFEKNRQNIPLYQMQAYGLQAQKLMQDISLFGMQRQKYQLALDMMEIERKYMEEYHKYRNESVKWDSRYKRAQAGISGLDFKNYQNTGLRPQDPYYMRIVGNTVEHAKDKGLWQTIKDWWNGTGEGSADSVGYENWYRNHYGY